MKVAYFVEWFPKLSETFLRREIDGLIEHGIEIEVFPYLVSPFRRAVLGYPVHYGGTGDLLRLPPSLIRELRGQRGPCRRVAAALAPPPADAPGERLHDP